MIQSRKNGSKIHAKTDKVLSFVRKAVNADGFALPRVSGGFAFAA